MLELSLWLVDSFTNEIFSGNPAGVCLVDEFFPSDLMQNIAFELHWSETAFVKRVSENRFHIRWFSPGDEAPICGHATLAAAHVLWQTKTTAHNVIIMQSLAGDLTVTKRVIDGADWISMDFPAKQIFELEDTKEIEKIRKSLGKINVEKFYTDNSSHIAVFSSSEDVRNCQPDLAIVSSLASRSLTITALTNSSEKSECDFVYRYFAPKVGISEDPVCGSSNCRLVPFWAKYLGKNSLMAHQVSKRGGVIKLESDDINQKVKICGQAKTIMSGKIFI